jgi:hypothetical protein
MIEQMNAVKSQEINITHLGNTDALIQDLQIDI